VVRHVHEFLFVPGMVIPSPAFLDVHGPGTLLVENAMVRLTRGAADVPQLQRAVNDLVAPGAPIDDLHLIQRRVDTTIGVERAALLLLAVAIAIAGMMLVGQALGRSVAIPSGEVGVLKAMGFDRSSMALCTALAHLVVAGVGALAALATAVVASHWFPLGLASQIDPDSGLHADWIVLGPGIALTVAVVLGSAAAIGWRLMNPRRSASFLRPSTLVERVTRVAPLTVGIGTTMALRPGGDRSSGFTHPALVGAVVGVLGVVGTITIDRGLNEALANPARAGVAWDATVTPAPSDRTETGVNQSRLDSIGALPDVAAAGVVSRLVSQVNDAGVPVFSVQPSVGSIALVSTSGRAPRGDGEAAIGPQTARQLNVDIGDTITVGSRRLRVRIVGQALFPADVHAGFDEGLWLTPNGLQSIEPPVSPDDFTGPDRSIAIRFRPGVDTGDAIAALQANQGESIAGIAPVEVPPELTNLENVRTLPRLLAGFLALLAMAAVAHLLATSVRWRRRDLATLRALGMTRGGARSVLTMQGTAVALVGLTVGIPLGVAVGRTGWRLITSRVPLSFVGPIALVSILVLVPAALAIVNLLAVWPGHAAARLRPAEVLRAE
jgi:ABC-type lipoprotein release transport system permease subunit